MNKAHVRDFINRALQDPTMHRLFLNWVIRRLYAA